MVKAGLSISKKLLSIGGSCFLVTLAVVAITWGSAVATQRRVSTYAQTAAVSREFSAMSQQFQEVRQAGFSAALGVANDDKYHQATQDFTTQLTKLQGASLDSQQREIVSRIQDLAAQIPVNADGVTLASLSTEMESQLESLRNSLTDKHESDVAELNTITSINSNIGLAVSLVGLVVVLLVSVLVSLSISRSAKEISKGLNRLSAKDFTYQVRQVSRDEIGAMSVLLNDSVKNLGALLSGISSTATETTAGAEGLREKSQDVAAKASAAKDTVASVAGNAREVSTQIGDVAASTEQMRSAVTEISTNAATAAKSAAQATTLTAQANDVMGELDKASEAISSVIETIKMVAEQTNLLALNATIEASRAGEAGRGFAVVASEVKDLALGTKSAAVEVSESITKIQSDTQAAMEAITEITGIISNINDYQSTVAAAIEEQTATISSMAQTVTEVSDDSAQVTDNLYRIEAKTEETVEELQEASQDMVLSAQEFEALQKTLSQFKWVNEA